MRAYDHASAEIVLKHIQRESGFETKDFVHLLFWNEEPHVALALSIILTAVLEKVDVRGGLLLGFPWQSYLDILAILPTKVGGVSTSDFSIGLRRLVDDSYLTTISYGDGVYVNLTQKFWEKVGQAQGWTKYRLAIEV